MIASARCKHVTLEFGHQECSVLLHHGFVVRVIGWSLIDNRLSVIEYAGRESFCLFIINYDLNLFNQAITSRLGRNGFLLFCLNAIIETVTVILTSVNRGKIALSCWTVGIITAQLLRYLRHLSKAFMHQHRLD